MTKPPHRHMPGNRYAIDATRRDRGWDTGYVPGCQGCVRCRR